MDESFYKLFPCNILQEIKEYITSPKLEEIRIKEKKPCILIVDNKEIIKSYIVNSNDIKYILQKISNYSLYAFEDEIKRGFITIKGGHRVGLAGECVCENGNVKTIKNITSLNIRICREIIGCSNNIMKYVINKKRVYNTLIISPPRCGKTTLLRDITRALSEKGKRISVIDERSEIAACFMGVPQMNIGLRTDVLDNCPKAIGMNMAIRSLSPDVIVTDEIGTNEDISSLNNSINSGVNVITTIHGFTIYDLINREVFRKILESSVFERIIILSNNHGIGTIEGIYKNIKGDIKEWEKLY